MCMFYGTCVGVDRCFKKLHRATDQITLLRKLSTHLSTACTSECSSSSLLSSCLCPAPSSPLHSTPLHFTPVHSTPLSYCWWALWSWIADRSRCIVCDLRSHSRVPLLSWATSTSHSLLFLFPPTSLLLVLVYQTMSMCSSSVFLCRSSRVTHFTHSSLCFWWNYSESQYTIYPFVLKSCWLRLIHVIL